MGKKLTQEKFLEKCVDVHGGKYDYSLVDYQGYKEKIIIICKDHGSFLQTAGNHKGGQGCKKCYFKRSKLSNDEFIGRAKAVHGDKYDYKLSQYKGSVKKVEIICSTHGVFKQVANYHLMGNGCPYCATELTADIVRKDRDYIVKKSIEVHGDRYDYSKVEYKGADAKICVICRKHGEFWQSASDHIRGRNCYKCSREAQSNELRKSLHEFILASKEVHGDKYDYSKSVYKGCEKHILITCKIHGDFKQRASNHMGGKGCPSCSESKGEKKIRVWLKRHGFKFKKEKPVYTGHSNRPQRIDFFLSDLNIAIEYHGEQHYFPNDFFGGSATLKYVQKMDKIKRSFCAKNGIRLIEIPYHQYDEINEILSNALLEKVA